ncbi:hypothetical protein BE04_27890 [Sorangium cellulosum]|uniref:Uncharacterized protein n=2 Tax=Sorangium cellulosum TaxID=56 RepID=A0A150P1B2_SORCE|nr:hypothetical protein SCE1572_28635 [Sorangium cellulosum So0157-2]KYF48765.1 hypothetical protein BE04_27890 [Sorangium cellulosum]
MSGQDHDVPPIPQDLAASMRALRAMGPSEALVERALSKLPERPERPAAEGGKRSQRAQSRWRWGAIIAAPALAALAVAVLLAGGGGASSPAIERSEERAVALPDDGHAWMHLDLWTHRHAEEPAVVHLEVPEHVRVRLPDGEGGALEEHCQQERCSHRLTRYRGDAPLSVAVAQPGRYEIHVRHESNEARVRERFVLTAVRD